MHKQLVLDRAAQAVIEAVDRPKLAHHDWQENLYIQLITDEAINAKRAFICEVGGDDNIAELFGTPKRTLLDVVELVSYVMNIPVCDEG